MVAEIWASVMSPFVDQLVALNPSKVGINMKILAASGRIL